MQAVMFYYNLFLFPSTQVVSRCEQQEQQQQWQPMVVVLVVPVE
jgi:hypothetical protein